jgi:hypothetical protein
VVERSVRTRVHGQRSRLIYNYSSFRPLPLPQLLSMPPPSLHQHVNLQYGPGPPSQAGRPPTQQSSETARLYLVAFSSQYRPLAPRAQILCNISDAINSPRGLKEAQNADNPNSGLCHSLYRLPPWQAIKRTQSRHSKPPLQVEKRSE